MIKAATVTLAVAVAGFAGSRGAPARTNDPPAVRVGERAVPNDNRSAAGRAAGGALALELEAREVSWHPEGDSGVAISLYAFAERGAAAQIPGPLIRVTAGTELHVTVRNTLSKSLRLRGLQDHTGAGLDSIDVAAGATHEIRFRATVPGTYYYWGRTEALPAGAITGRSHDANLVGAFIVDSAGSAPRKGERVLVITGWTDTAAAWGVKSDEAHRIMRREGFARDVWPVFAVNGRSWPHTERLSYTQGDTIHWRVINGSRLPHPMHLHGFFFQVRSRGDAQRDTAYSPAQRRDVVTEWLVRGTTMTMDWVAERPGNWMFHCHIIQHISDALRPPSHAASHDGGSIDHAQSGMAGLVTGIHIAPARRARPARNPGIRRKLRLFITERARVYGEHPGFSYVLQRGPTPPAADSVLPQSSTIVLREREPAEITIVNRTKLTTGIHWHGLELESFFDGVGGWSGWGSRVAPMIAPGDSFVVRLTPPRAGTFMYHTHASEGVQIVSGLHGALLVLPRNVSHPDPGTVFMLSIAGPHDEAPTVINGLVAPPPVLLRAGTPHRLRFINISPIETHTIQLVAGDSVQQWRALAKDGAELPPSQATTRIATLALHPGETYDFEVTRSHPGELSIRVSSIETVANRNAFQARPEPRGTLQPVVTKIPLIFR